MLQTGETPFWKTEDYPTLFRDEDDSPSYAYDHGIVVSFELPNKYNEVRVVFQSENGFLNYESTNLWVFELD